jgi:hypothetical protein
VNLGTEPQRARQRDQKPCDHSGEPKECVDHGCLHEVECYTRDGVLRVLDRRISMRRGGHWRPISGTFSCVGRFRRSETIREKAMKLAAIGLATALALAGPTAFAMGGSGAGASGGVGSTYTNSPAECGGLVCFAKSRSIPLRVRPHVGVRSQSAPAEPRTCRCRWCGRGRRPDGCYGPA